MRHPLELLAGLWELFRLGLITHFRLGGPYWKWRKATAFGRGSPPPAEMRRLLLEHARWIARMRRHM